MSFIFSCPHCKQKFEADEEMIGQIENCPYCKKTININFSYEDKLNFAPSLKEQQIKDILMLNMSLVLCA